MRILFTGGGTGGHFFPIVAVARELKRIAEEEQILDLELFYMGPDDFGQEVIVQEEIFFLRVGTGKMRRYVSALNFLDFFKTFFGVIRGVWRMFFVMPDVVFSKGGYGAVPAIAGAILFRIPLIIHESDSIPGTVNRFAARFAVRVGIAFPSAAQFFPKGKTAVVGIPIRKRILGGNIAHAKESLSIFTDAPVIGVIGASQGSQKINEAVLGILKELAEEFEIVHQTGQKNFEDVKGEGMVTLEFAHKEHYHPVSFFDEQGMRDFYAASDLIVSRAGASSIFEIAAWAKPAILVPLLNSAQEHQLKNAYEYAAVGAAEIIEEANLTPHILLGEIKRIIQNKDGLRRMGEAAQRFSRIDAAEIIARELLRLGLHEKLK
ncbi:MAG: UDP-N-acetylglucosamine--N-acetylmuramyl-(pentapeptide) pyrophosphoryl-undecaprenol N-acetylglucosamine transferase [bacterium]|nr:UDP-N-acetylglucosamine--N-acetylmuramyl-(pentapeptide) pyrophosphoryl-undecaprenol N-acetylglucosamine transferase [bacterium]MDZ4285859.1 UDP-N-acetylglucosamine--N-acetylmuramyl-(pentapeptide) pyrophosphoryl-undecaprenol N-acetylglucosamine transferase [Candidatus Sungbacteria bacterium]